MNPAKASYLAVFIAGIIFTLIIVSSHTSQVKTPDNDISQATNNAAQLSDHIAMNWSEIQQSMESLSYHTFWQTAPVAEWSYWLETQAPIYQTAGLNYLGVYSSQNNVLYLDKPSRAGLFGDLNTSIKSLTSTKEAVSSIIPFKGDPSLITLVPIKDIDGNLLGALVGIKLLNQKSLKQYHYFSKIPVAIVQDDTLKSISVDGSPNLNDYIQLDVSWPKFVTNDNWKLVLLVNQPSAISITLIYIGIGIFITLILAVFIAKQIKASNDNIQSIDNCLDIKLPISEQISQLTNLINHTHDPQTVALITSMKQRFEQQVQQKKLLNIELRKAQENEQALKATTSSLSSERDKAMAAPRIKSEFLSRMGDEITTPMKSVVSMLKLLSEYDFESEPKQLLNIAKRSTRTLVDNLNNILDFSKLDAELLQLKPLTFSVRELVDDLSAELSHYVKEKDLAMQASCAPEIPSLVNADTARIRQILRNLLGNAIRFTREGEVSLYVDLYNKDDTQLLRFTVKDSGVGIPAEAQHGLFDSLERQTKLTNSSFAGRLRLIVSKNLAELMGGEIGVISEPGKGSQFWFTVAFKESE